ncbi:YggS family pyridoxal phosphate-dependent enzyme [Gordonia sp. VNK21]|uniref:YggS family pyridoxal phosphate-dependent enzyme n=1 Tax=Gordonia sp. VNK21 TaxID=3382483 RepID=UPI0038D3F02E
MAGPIGEGSADQVRRAQLSESLAAARERVAAAERAAGRPAGSARLMVVTKYFPARDMELLIELGAAEFGENREPEAGRKVAQVREDRPESVFTVDMIGSLQRKKARTVARWAHRVQSVDSAELVDALAAAARSSLERGDRTTPLGVLLQLSLDGDPRRGGAVAGALPALADQVLAADDALRLDGLMVIAPLSGEAGAHLAAAARVHEQFRERYPQAVELSAGMSGDLEDAIVNGSTCVRVGTAIMGPRPILSP